MTEILQTIKLDGIHIDRPVAEVTAQDVDDMLVTIRRQRRSWRNVERAAQMGDRVVIDYKGTVDGRSFAGGSGTRLPIVLGSSGFLPAFDEGLVGCKVGGTREVRILFPRPYSVVALAGMQAIYTVTVHTVAEEVLPALDSEFVRSFGVSSGDISQLRRDIEANMRRELAQTLKVMVKNRVMDELLGRNAVPPAPEMIDQEVERLLAKAKRDVLEGAHESGYGLSPELFREQAARRIALGAILNNIAAEANISLDYARVHALIETECSSYDDPVAAARLYYEDSERMREIETVALEDQIVEWVLDHVTMDDSSTTFQAVMGLAQHTTSASKNKDKI
jgi:trigger factor